VPDAQRLGEVSVFGKVPGNPFADACGRIERVAETLKTAGIRARIAGVDI